MAENITNSSPDSIQDNLVSPPYDSSKIIEPKKYKLIYLKMKKLIFALIFIILVLSVIGFYFYFFIYNSSERIFNRMYKKVSNIYSFDYNSEIILAYKQKLTQTETISSDYKAVVLGSVDLNKINPSSKASIEIFSDKTSIGKAEYMNFSKILFIKMYDSLASQILDFEKFSGKWIKLDIETVDILSGTELFENLARANEIRFEFYKIVKTNPPITILQRLPDDNLNGKKVYHFKVVVDKENLILDFLKFSQTVDSTGMSEDFQKKVQDIFSQVEFREADLWISKDYYPYKIKMAIETSENISNDINIAANLVLNFDKFDEPKGLVAPGVFIQPQEFLNWMEEHF